MSRFARLMVWAVDGRGSIWQGRPAIGIAAIAMLGSLAVVTALVGMGVERGSTTYNAAIVGVVATWVVAIAYLLCVLAFASYRLAQEGFNAMKSIVPRKKTDG